MHGEDVDVFIKESDAWHDLLGRQKDELPKLSEMLYQAIQDRREADEEMLAHAEMLRNGLTSMENCLQRLRDALALQISYLSERSNGRKNGFWGKSFSHQNRLRNEIHIAEKKYFELKSSLLNYVWSVTLRH